MTTPSIHPSSPGGKPLWKFGLVALLLMGVGLFLFRSGEVSQGQINAMRSLGSMLRQYAESHDGQFPERFEEVLEKGNLGLGGLLERGGRDAGHAAYEYFGGTLKDAPQSMLMRVPPGPRGEPALVLLKNGEVRTRP
jgi:hypothetical protein